jgi:RNA polymerase sigma-70 factor, ECF subfamily
MTDDARDAALFAALSRGDATALEQLYDAHSAIVFAVALHQLGDRARAEDVLHDVFLELAHLARTPDAACPRVLRWLVTRVFEHKRRSVPRIS